MGGIYWLASYPKSGNTWFRVVLANYISDSDKPLDINQLNTGPIASSRLWIDDVSGFDTSDMTPEEINSLRPHVYRWSAQESGISYHKIHDSFSRARNGRPIIDDIATLGAVYIVRNPLDIAASLANHNNCSIEHAIDLMADESYSTSKSQNKLSTQIFQHIGSWSYHVKSWLNATDIPIHVIRYEDMLEKPEDVFSAAFSFLGISESIHRLRRAIRNSSFEILQAQEQSSYFREKPPNTKTFFRTGKRDNWKFELHAHQTERIKTFHNEMMSKLNYITLPHKTT